MERDISTVRRLRRPVTDVPCFAALRAFSRPAPYGTRARRQSAAASATRARPHSARLCDFRGRFLPSRPASLCRNAHFRVILRPATKQAVRISTSATEREARCVTSSHPTFTKQKVTYHRISLAYTYRLGGFVAPSEIPTGGSVAALWMTHKRGALFVGRGVFAPNFSGAHFRAAFCHPDPHPFVATHIFASS